MSGPDKYVNNTIMINNNKTFFLILFCILHILPLHGQFLDEFDITQPDQIGETPQGWDFATGDGMAEIEFIQAEGYASIIVDASKDNRNIWWALVKVEVPGLDLNQLMKEDYELRAEARIRTSHSPRRVNLHFNHQRTTDFHSHLMEYDIPRSWEWHTISMTTKDFEVRSGDRINAQMALMDWGKGTYRIDIDYFKVDVVPQTEKDSDLGEPLPYHPPVADPDYFAQRMAVVEDATIDRDYSDKNFNDWKSGNEDMWLLTTSGSQTIILRWDFSNIQDKKALRSGLLELYAYSIQRSPEYKKDFGMIRVSEIIGGDPTWEQESVTYDNFRRNRPVENTINTQMVIDNEVSAQKGSRTLITISRPVLQRLLDGKTKGLAIEPLGAVHATFISMENEGGKYAPGLYMDIE